VRRQQWFEIHDSRWFPGFLRDLVTEALESIWNRNGTYRPIAGRLREALRQAGTTDVVDLCSGGGGPWPGLYDEVAAGGPLTVRLTDRMPNAGLVERGAGPRDGLIAEAQTVDATCVPERLRGFRTVFSAFHHFDPEAARAMLADAFRRREGIGIFEVARPTLRAVVTVFAVPFLALRAAAMARPVRWSRLVWTFVLPLVPVVLFVDGVLSCLRSYSLNDLRELTAEFEAADYQWQVGEEAGLAQIAFLLGGPPGERPRVQG
jgi:hypothetical protein